MRILTRLLRLLPFALIVPGAPLLGREPSVSRAQAVMRIWPGDAPGTEDWKVPEEGADVSLPNVGKVHVITNVTVPTLTVFRPARSNANGAAIVVLPGGSFRALAWDVDGLETARWLASKGITAFVLKYRVRALQKGETFGETLEDFANATRLRRAIALADAEQAIRYVRLHARQYTLDRTHIGMIGFSAGAMTTVEVALSRDPAVRPNFAAVLYGAALVLERPGLGAPPLFIAAAQDDPQLPVANSVEVFRRWSGASVPAELHIYEKGGHGFGFRGHGVSADNWPIAFEAWLAARENLYQPGRR